MQFHTNDVALKAHLARDGASVWRILLTGLLALVLLACTAAAANEKADMDRSLATQPVQRT
jgi:NADH:ubiquinone oxidoreductase subunit 4 (subunit M)